jgi:hypothetical protein
MLEFSVPNLLPPLGASPVFKSSAIGHGAAGRLFQKPIAGHLPPSEVDASHIAQRFADDYWSARRRFRSLTESAAGQLFSYPISTRVKARGDLTIDIAHLTCSAPSECVRKAVVILSGVHGVEGPVGSAVQQELLGAKPVIPANCAIVLVHVLNPYGMVQNRRATENNVDLNRNFVHEYRGGPARYDRVRRSFSVHTLEDLPRCLARLDQLKPPTLHKLMEITSPGQHEFPEDSYYGGSAREVNLQILTQHLERYLRATEQLLFYDIHTGLGRSGEDILFFLGKNTCFEKTLAGRLAPEYTVQDPRRDVPYFDRARGHVLGGLLRHFSDRFAYGVVQEIGTYPEMLAKVLCLENACRSHPAAAVREQADLLVREFFCPGDLDWRRGVLQRSSDIVARAAVTLFDFEI